jgi:hypothetical protein
MTRSKTVTPVNTYLTTPCRTVAGLFILGISAYSTSTATARRVEDFIPASDGTAFSGKLRIAPCSARAVSTCVARRSFLVAIVSGYFDADLSTEPGTTFFHAQYLSGDQRVQWEEQWVLPPLDAVWQLADVRVNSRSPMSGDGDLHAFVIRPVQAHVMPTEAAAPSVRGIGGPPVPGNCDEDLKYAKIGPTLPGVVDRPFVLPPGAKPPARPECIALLVVPQPVYTTASVKLPSLTPGSMRSLSRSAQLIEGDVAGLISDLQSRVVKGPGFSNSRAAIIDDTGGIESAVGNPSDCVRVDGTSGPCSSSGGNAILFIDGETPSGAIDGVNAVFTIAGTPSPAQSLELFRNGLFLSVGIDYSLSANSITFFTGAVPQTGDLLVARYRK